MKRSRILTAIGTVVTTVLVAAGCSSSADSSSPSTQSSDSVTGAVTIGLSYIPNAQFAPVYVADQKGYYTNEGVTTTLRHHGSDESTWTALLTGEEQVLIASGDEVLQARDQGIDVISVGAYYQSYPITVIVPEASDMTTLSDLRGKTIGIPGLYGSSYYGLLAALSQAGLTESDVTVMAIGYTQQAALASGQVDAVVGFTNNDLVSIQQAGIAVRTISLADNTPLVSASIITTRSWATQNPQLLRQVIAATIQGVQTTVDDSATALTATQQYDDTLASAEAISTAQAVLDATSKLYVTSDGTVTGVQDLTRWNDMGTFLRNLDGVLSGTPDVSAAVTNDYVS